MLPILWRAEARADLAATLEYIAERNPQSAPDLYDDIERVVSQLRHHLYLYLYRSGRVPGTRELVAQPNYIVVYRVSTIAAEIVSILHSRQQYPRSLTDGSPLSPAAMGTACQKINCPQDEGTNSTLQWKPVRPRRATTSDRSMLMIKLLEQIPVMAGNWEELLKLLRAIFRLFGW